ncbi:MAG: type III-B CRISPR module RAMP protein Cmr6 [Ktedonobacteraceae bacterium]
MSTRRNKLSSVNVTDSPNPHAGLWLDKYIIDQINKNASPAEKSDNQKQENSRSTVVTEASALSIPEAYNEFYQQWEKMLAEYGALIRKATVKGRMIVGLGNESVLETSITLHRTYGVPYIPGSALKGLAASYVQQKLSETWHTGGEAHKIIFGDTDNAGYVVFFDALYIPNKDTVNAPLRADIITVHHPDYYQGSEKAPADWDSPTPISFLTATGSYLIAVAAPDLEKGTREQWLNTTLKIIEGALETLGIGAKTSSGYGRMEFEIDLSSPDMQAALALQQQIESIPDAKVGSQIDPMFSRWAKLPSDNAKKMAGRAIIKKVQDAKAESSVGAKGWYKVLQAFLNK